MSPAQEAPRYRSPFGLWILVSLGLALASVAVLWARPHFADLIAATEGVLQGTPHWRLFQSRILGPSLYLGLKTLGGLEPAQAFLLSSGLCLWAFYALLLRFNQCLGGTFVGSLGKALAAFLCFTFLLARTGWFYLWDAVDLVVFTSLAYALSARKPLSWFVVLIALEILNREVALALAVCLGLEALGRLGSREGRRQALASVLLGSASILISEYLRRELFLMEWGPLWLPNEPKETGVNFQLWANIQSFIHLHLVFPSAMRWFLVPLLPLWLVWRAWKQEESQRLCFLVPLLGATLCLGVFSEWRVWLWTLPFLFLESVEPWKTTA